MLVWHTYAHVHVAAEVGTEDLHQLSFTVLLETGDRVAPTPTPELASPTDELQKSTICPSLPHSARVTGWVSKTYMGTGTQNRVLVTAVTFLMEQSPQLQEVLSFPHCHL